MRWKISISAVILFMILQAVCGSAQETSWTRVYGGSDWDGGSSVQQTEDGGYIVAGWTWSFGAGWCDVYLIKTNPQGNVAWTQIYGGSGYDRGNSVQQTTDGGYIVCGYTESYGAGWYDIYLIKTDPQGDSLWTKTYGGTGFDWGYSVQQTEDGGYVVAGPTESFGAGSADIYLIKTDPQGDTLWTKTYGGSYLEEGYSVQQTEDGGYIVVGLTSSYGAGNEDIYLVKTDPQGDILWMKTYGGTGYDGGRYVQQTEDGGFIVVEGPSSYGVVGENVYLLRTDSQGDSLWMKTYGGTSYDWGYCVKQTEDGGYIVTGVTESFGAGSADVYMIKTGSQGDTLWTRTYGGSHWDTGSSVQQTVDGGYILTGWTWSFGAGSADVYLIKTDAEGGVGVVGFEPNFPYMSEFHPPFPNPFNPTTTLSFTLPAPGLVKLEVFDIKGQPVGVEFTSTQFPAGTHHILFDGSDLPSGIYLARLTAKNWSAVRKLVLLK